MDASIFDTCERQRIIFGWLFGVSCVSLVAHVMPFWGVGCVFYRFTYVISSFEEQTVDALASGAEEGRSNLR